MTTKLAPRRRLMIRWRVVARYWIQLKTGTLSIPSRLLAILDNGGPTSHTASRNQSRQMKRMPGRSCTWLRSSSSNKPVEAVPRRSPNEYAGWPFGLGLYRGNNCRLGLCFPFLFFSFLLFAYCTKRKSDSHVFTGLLSCFYFSGFCLGVAVY